MLSDEEEEEEEESGGGGGEGKKKKKVMVRSPSSIVFLFILFLLDTVCSNPMIQRQVTQSPSSPSFVTIPVVLPHYNGTDAPAIDNCPRNEVKLHDGRCYPLLTRGPCASTHYVVIDPTNNLGYCGPRLCSPDRIFIFTDQLCHDPRDPQLCPKGRQLYQSSFGTPVCQCPDGTYESEDDDSDEEGECEPMLAPSASCPPGQVLWFRNFSSPRECLLDPCGGENLKRAPEDLLLVPSVVDGVCYPLGQSEGVCPNGTWFTLALNQLQGVCSRLEDAGYLILDQRDLADYEEFYGPLIPKDTVQFPSELQDTLFSKENVHLLSTPPFMKEKDKIKSKIVGISVTRSPVLQESLTRGEVIIKESVPQHSQFFRLIQKPDKHLHSMSQHLIINSGIDVVKGELLTATRVQGDYRTIFDSKISHAIGVPISQRLRAVDMAFGDAIAEILVGMSHHTNFQSVSRGLRRSPRQAVLPHFTPGNIFDTRLVACRSGAKRDVNAKCRDIILPSRAPPKPPASTLPASAMSPSGGRDAERVSRSVPPVPPKPHCLPGEAYNIQRLCDKNSSAVNSIIAQNLG